MVKKNKNVLCRLCAANYAILWILCDIFQAIAEGVGAFTVSLQLCEEPDLTKYPFEAFSVSIFISVFISLSCSCKTLVSKKSYVDVNLYIFVLFC